MQEDEPAGGQLLVVACGAEHVGGEGDGIRSDALGRGHLGDADLGTQPDVPQGLERRGELRGLAAG